MIHYVEQHRDPDQLWELTCWQGVGEKIAEDLCLVVDDWRARNREHGAEQE